MIVRRVATRAAGHVVVLHIPADKYVPDGSAPATRDLEPAHYVRNWGKFAALMRDLIKNVEGEGGLPDGFAVLSERLTAAQNDVPTWSPSSEKVEFRPEFKTKGPVTASSGGTIGSLFYHAPSEPVLTIQAKIENAVDQLTAKFQEELDRVGGASGAVVLVDEFDKLSGHLIATWLLRLVTGTTRAVVVLTTRVVPEELAEYERDMDADEELLRFSDEDVRLYLTRRFGPEVATEALVARVAEFGDRLPQGVAMAGDLIQERLNAGRAHDLDDLRFDEKAPAETRLVTAIVRDLAKAGDDETAAVLKEGRLARRIDLELVHYLQTGDVYEEGSVESRRRAGRTWETLENYSFIEEPEALKSDGLARYRFHEYIRRARLPDDHELEVDDEEVHARLAAYYERRLDEYDEAAADHSAYMQWYKYEQPEWQALTHEWLYHSGLLRREEARAAARLELARVFLEAFWWWGCYVEFDFCTRILDDWDATQPPEDLRWSGYLRELVRNYPLGAWKLDGPGWEAVAQALTKLRKEAKIDRRVPALPPAGADERTRKRVTTQRAVRAFTSIFQAHTERFRSGRADLALPSYADALAHLDADDDAAAVAWSTFELAELQLELEDREAAAESLREATRVLLESGEEDLELRANLHRLRADLAAADDPAADVVLDATARAVLWAYAFQIEPNGAPDDYTVAFYDELRERAATRILAVREATREDAAAAEAAVRLASLLDPIATPFDLRVDAAAAQAALDDPAELKALLTPPAPAVGDAGLADARFATTARRIALRLTGDPSDAALLEGS